MKRKEHRFTVVVKNPTSRKCAELALLCTFAERMPDGCEFHLRKSASKSERELAAMKALISLAVDCGEACGMDGAYPDAWEAMKAAAK